MIAREWLVRGNGEADPIDAFSNYWRGFNNLFFGVIRRWERDKIKVFLSENISEEVSEALLQDCANEVAYLLSKPVIDMRGNGADTSENIKAFNAAASSLEKLQEVFMIIYQVRCNLEHGQKSPTAERDVVLCQSALPLVAYVVSRNS